MFSLKKPNISKGREKTASLFILLWAKNPQALEPSIPRNRNNSNKKDFFIIEFKNLKQGMKEISLHLLSLLTGRWDIFRISGLYIVLVWNLLSLKINRLNLHSIIR